MKILIILNDPLYGTERSFNGLRLAKSLNKNDSESTVFLMADAVICGKKGQKVPQGFYNIELMLKSVEMARFFCAVPVWMRVALLMMK